MPNGRCRMHGGKNTGPPKGNQNALTHGIYSSAVLDQEAEEFEAAGKVRDLKQDLALARLRLLRAEKIHAELQEDFYNGYVVDSAELERSFLRCDRLARTVGRLQTDDVKVIEIRDLQEELDGLKQRLPKAASGG